MKGRLQGIIDLPGSKSESNRALMIAAYGGFPPEVDNLSEAHDTVLLQQLLDRVNRRSSEEILTLDCENAGAVARFLMPFLTSRPGEWLITGAPRLYERPMAPLIDALRQLGAEMDCLGAEGALPVRIKGKALKGGSIKLDASQSSQFASSLLMAAPTWPQGLTLELLGQLSSLPYVEMTLSIMHSFGVETIRKGNCIVVRPQSYRAHRLSVSPDWSSASYWYEMMALSDGGELLLKGLKSNSLQGDSAVVGMFGRLGVKTEFTEDGARLSKSDNRLENELGPLVFDFINTPDLFPSVFVTCVALHIDAIFQNISTLYKKESDRINSIITELLKIYTFINIINEDKIIINKSSLRNIKFDNRKVVFNTYQDHRIAMALAGLFPCFGEVLVDDPTVVNKSYPGFWNELKKLRYFF